MNLSERIQLLARHPLHRDLSCCSDTQYLSQPVFNSLIPDEQLTALAALLEEPSETQAFIDQLRKERA